MIAASIPKVVQARVRAAAGNRCGYCRSLQCYVFGPLEIEHILRRRALHVEVTDAPGVGLDKLFAGGDLVAHQGVEDFVGDDGILEVRP